MKKQSILFLLFFLCVCVCLVNECSVVLLLLPPRCFSWQVMSQVLCICPLAFSSVTPIPCCFTSFLTLSLTLSFFFHSIFLSSDSFNLSISLCLFLNLLTSTNFLQFYLISNSLSLFHSFLLFVFLSTSFNPSISLSVFFLNLLPSTASFNHSISLCLRRNPFLSCLFQSSISLFVFPNLLSFNWLFQSYLNLSFSQSPSLNCLFQSFRLTLSSINLIPSTGSFNPSIPVILSISFLQLAPSILPYHTPSSLNLISSAGYLQLHGVSQVFLLIYWENHAS